MPTQKEKPIIFNTQMVSAILNNSKTMTRRVVKKGGVQYCGESGLDKMGKIIDGVLHYTMQTEVDASKEYHEKCPYGKIGDRLWVRETFCYGEIVEVDTSDGYPEDCYISQCPDENEFIPKEYCFRNDIGIEEVIWKPSIHMFRKHSRINLEITDIRVERVQDISHEDAIAEGFPDNIEPNNYGTGSRARDWFAKLWDSINAKRGYGWEVNPCVWIITFKVLKREV